MGDMGIKRLARRARVEIAKRMLSRNVVFVRVQMAGSTVGRSRFFALLSGQDSGYLPFTSKEIGELAKAIGCTKKRLS